MIIHTIECYGATDQMAVYIKHKTLKISNKNYIR